MSGCRWAGRALPPSGGGDAVPTAGAKGDVGHLRFPMSPLDTPLTFRWPLSKAFAAKREKRGLGSVRRFGYIELQYPEFTLRSLQRRQCAAIRCRAVALRCEKLRFHQERTLGAPNAPVGPSHLDARPEGVASKGGSGVSRGEREPSVPCPLLSPPPDGGIAHAMSWRTSPGPGGPVSPPAASRWIGGKAFPLLSGKIEGALRP